MKSIFKKISLSSDDGGFNLTERIKKYLIKKKIKVIDLGPNTDKSVDYPDFAKKVARSVSSKKSNMLFSLQIFLNNFKNLKLAGRIPPSP